jgi:hypothetical protein
MANDISANPWHINVVASGSTVVLYPYPIKIKNIVWANPGAGSTLILQDKNGRDIVNATTIAGQEGNWTFGAFDWVQGLIVNTLSAGEVTIAIGAGK